MLFSYFLPQKTQLFPISYIIKSKFFCITSNSFYNLASKCILKIRAQTHYGMNEMLLKTICKNDLEVAYCQN